MNNKIIFIILFLIVGWNTYQQIQITNKTSESEIISSELTNQKSRFLLANKTSTFTLNDANKMIQELQNKILALTNNNIKLTAKINEIQTSLNNYVKKQDSKNKKTTQITDGLYSTNEKMKNIMINITEHIPKTYFYGPYYPPTWSWITTPINLSTLQHPTSTKLTIAKKSLVTLSINGHLNTSGQWVQVLFFIDNKPIPEYNNDFKSFYNTYMTNVNGLSSLDLQQEVIIQPGTYVFEFGIRCGYCYSKEVGLSGIGYTIKVQELLDPLIITNQNF